LPLTPAYRQAGFPSPPLGEGRRSGIWKWAVRAWLETDMPPVFGKEMVIKISNGQYLKHGYWLFYFGLRNAGFGFLSLSRVDLIPHSAIRNRQ